jgi:hypothetical protein
VNKALCLVAASLGLGALVSAFACGSRYEVAEAPDAGVPADAEPAPDAGPADPCAHVGPAAAPATDDATDVELPPFVLAVSDLHAGDDSLGFDLDGVCTCDGAEGAAHAGASSCNVVGKRCDPDGGVDDGFGAFARQFASFYDIDGIMTKMIAAGRRTVLLQISKYNGRANDREVAVGLIVSEGIRVAGCPTSVYDDKKKVYSPGWCGDDAWSLSADSVLQSGGQAQPISIGSAYVTDYELVVRVGGSLAMPIGEDNRPIQIGSPVIAGKLVPLGADLAPRDPSRPPAQGEERLYRVDGVLAGRMTASDLLAAIGMQPSAPGSSDELCQKGTAFQVAKQQVCDALDIARTGQLDFDPQASCDALSGALGFTAEPALRGDVQANELSPDPCTPGPTGDPLDASVTYHCP